LLQVEGIDLIEAESRISPLCRHLMIAPYTLLISLSSIAKRLIPNYLIRMQEFFHAGKETSEGCRETRVVADDPLK